MVTALRSLTFAALSLGASAAFGRCTPGSEFEPSLCPFQLPPVARIVIEENAAKSTLEPDAALSCASFRVDGRLVLRYLRRIPRCSGRRVTRPACSRCATVGRRAGS